MCTHTHTHTHTQEHTKVSKASRDSIPASMNKTYIFIPSKPNLLNYTNISKLYSKVNVLITQLTSQYKRRLKLFGFFFYKGHQICFSEVLKLIEKVEERWSDSRNKKKKFCKLK